MQRGAIAQVIFVSFHFMDHWMTYCEGFQGLGLRLSQEDRPLSFVFLVPSRSGSHARFFKSRSETDLRTEVDARTKENAHCPGT